MGGECYKDHDCRLNFTLWTVVYCSLHVPTIFPTQALYVLPGSKPLDKISLDLPVDIDFQLHKSSTYYKQTRKVEMAVGCSLRKTGALLR